MRVLKRDQLFTFIFSTFIFLFISPSIGISQDCTDILSNRQVQNTTDCGSWCGDYVFTLGSGNCFQAGSDLFFTEYTDGTAKLIGSIVQGSNTAYLDISFSGRTSVTPQNSPKYMLCIDSGGEYWYYYPVFSGTFTYPNGNTTTISRTGPSFQVGYGANVQTTNFGASGWFSAENGDSGDLNFELSSPTTCEEEDIVLEVECAEVGSLFEVHEDANASNGDFVMIEDGNTAFGAPPSSPEGRVRFTVNISNSGPYNIFARVKAPSNSHDSFWVRVNNNDWIKWNKIEASNSFIWDQVHNSSMNNLPVSFFLETGVNTIDFAYRDDGTALDKIYISQALEAPIGIGAEASNCICFNELNISCTPASDPCSGDGTLGINVENNGTDSNLTFLWSNGETTQNITDLTPGTYSVTVTGESGCTATCETTLEAVEPFSIQCDAINATCNYNASVNDNGVVSISVTGGTGPYIYHWSNNACTSYEDNLEVGTYTITVTDANGCSEICSVDVGAELPISLNCVVLNNYCEGNENSAVYLEMSSNPAYFSYLWSNGSTEEVLSGVGPGTYGVTVTHDASGCSKSCEAIIEDHEPLSILCEGTDTNCGNNNGGTITITAAGGTAPYIYHWSNNACTSYEENLEEGTYTITVTDNNGCSEVCSVDIGTSDSSITATATTTNNIDCESEGGTCNGSINLSVSDGQAPFTFLWSNGETTEDINGLCDGTYSVTISEANGCGNTFSYNIVSGTSLDLICSAEETPCEGNNGSSIIATVSGGSGNYTFNWSNGATTQNLDALNPGTYTLTVTDTYGCEITCTTIINDVPTLTANCSSTDISCAGSQDGTAIVSVSGGSAPFTFLWNTGSTNNNISNLEAGSYSVVVRDANGCETTCSTTINEVSTLNATCSSTNTNCGAQVGTTSVSASGGLAPYTYLWNNGATTNSLSNLGAGNYSVTVTDTNGCEAICNTSIASSASMTLTCTPQSSACGQSNGGAINVDISGGSGTYTFGWSNGATTQNISDLASGTYSLTVTDENGCEATCSTDILVYDPLVISCNYTDFICSAPNFANLSSSASGGDGNYTFQWSNGSSNQNLENIMAGVYTVTVTDGQGCSATCSVEIPDTAPIVVTCNAQNGGCDAQNGSIITTVSGGAGSYTYLWSDGSTNPNLENITPGTYFLTVTDAMGCTGFCQTEIVGFEPLSASCSANDLDCGELNTGLATVSATGGATPYNYLWSNGATTQTIENINEGNYTVTVTDANGCTTTCEANVSTPAPVIVVSNSIPLDCPGGSTSSADFTIEGGVPPYSYLWDNGSTDPILHNLTAGFYGITVTDANGCIGICGTWVVEPDAINVTFENNEVSCFGGNDGSIATAITGGTGAYTFSWSNGETTQNISGLETGVYTITVSDENGCTNAFSTTIESNDPVSVICTPTPLSCPGTSTGSILVNATGGTGNFTYAWSNGATTPNLFNLSEGAYALTITDDNGCSTTCNSIIESPTPLNITCTPSDLICAGPETGSINVEVTGGTAPYTYQWDNGSTAQNLDLLNTGTYSLTVTDANGCTISCASTVESSLPLTTATNGQDLLCGEAGTGSVGVTVNGGTAPFTFLWNNGATTQNQTGLDAGTYEVEVTDAKGCTSTASQTIISIEPLTLSCNAQDLVCGDANSGNINLSISGGTAPFTFEWSNGDDTQNLEGVNEGTYSVLVTDANGCTSTCSSTLIYIQPLAASCSAQDLICASPETGGVNLTLTGGTAPFIYQWSNGALTQDLTNLNAGTYTVTIIDANNCTTTCSSIVASDEPLVVACNVDGATCGNSNSGNIDIDVDGGLAPYTFLWSNGATTEDLTDILSGFYTVTVTDANGCETSCSSTVEVSLGLNLSCEATGTQCGESMTGSIELTVTGGTGNYTYEWSNGATTQHLENLDAGSFSVTVSDSNGCSSICSSTVAESSAMEAVCEPMNIPCGGQMTGSVDVTVTGGAEPYGFEWSNGSIAEDINGVGAGTYSVTVTDSNGCTTICSSTVTESPAFSLSCNASNVSCKNGNNGSVTLVTSGGAEPFTFVWSNGATTQNLDNLTDGNYSVTATDANGCEASCSSFISEPATLLVIASGNNISCNGTTDGTAFATVIGGTVPYSYAWSNGSTTPFVNALSAGTYTLTVTDANGCMNFGSVSIQEPELLSVTCTPTHENCEAGTGGVDLTIDGGTAPFSYLWSNGETTSSLENTNAGNYSVTVTDAKGCNAVCSTAIDPVNPIILSCEASPETCATPSFGSVDLTVSGGTAPYFYQWSNGTGTEDLASAAAGTYSVTVTDATGCSSVCTSIVEAAPTLNVQLTKQDLTCNGAATGSIQTTVGQGLAPYSFVWSNGATTSAINNLSAGTYTLTVTDANGCMSIVNETITQPSNLIVVTSGNPTTCNGGNNGTAFATAIGGTAPYQYAWSNDMVAPFINSLSAGDYTVTVTDANGCSTVSIATVAEPAAISIEFNSSLLTCDNDNNGSIQPIITGGLAPFIYLWNTGATTESISDLTAGSYTLIITDANGCTGTATTTIQTANPIILACNSEPVLCFGDENGSAGVTASGGAAPYSFAWSNGSTDADIDDLPAGTYSVTVTDANGCEASCSTIVESPALLHAEYGSIAVTCNGGNNGILFADPIGGVAPYNYQWSTGDNTPTVENLTSGAYGLTLTDDNGCVFICGILITEPEAISCSTDMTAAASGNPNLYDIEVTATGGTGNLEYSIDGGTTFQASSIFTDLIPSVYDILIMDENGCTSECQAQVLNTNGLLGDHDGQNREGDVVNMGLAPNPAITDINVVFETLETGFTIVEVKNMVGKVLYYMEMEATEGANTVNIDLNNFNTGTYMMTVFSKGGMKTQQFSVIK